MNPMFDTELPLDHVFVLALRGFPDQRLFPRLSTGGAFFGEAFNRGSMTVRTDQSRQCLNQVPGGAIDSRFVARVEIFLGSAMPVGGAGNQLELDHAFRTEVDGNRAVERLHRHGHVNASALTEGRKNVSGPPDYLGEVRRTDFFFAFSATKTRFTGSFLPAALKRVQGREPGCFGSFLDSWLHGR